MTQETKSVAGLLALLAAAVGLFLAASPSLMQADPQTKATPVPAAHIIVPKPQGLPDLAGQSAIAGEDGLLLRMHDVPRGWAHQ